ncbi:hypothetical protein CDAR_413431 [Caerostris darwini]|uniref:Uncharacterized protein n=1 Tax=Caerostris darwini TaxID=1538125 RepID=A0AAV4S5Y4_9ARAC|nr:hypothetical protein CDAR_413431 [Caerostris darwini]
MLDTFSGNSRMVIVCAVPGKKSPLEIVTTKQDQSSRVKAVGLERRIVPNSSASSDPGRPFERTVRCCLDGLEGLSNVHHQTKSNKQDKVHPIIIPSNHYAIKTDNSQVRHPPERNAQLARRRRSLFGTTKKHNQLASTFLHEVKPVTRPQERWGPAPLTPGPPSRRIRKHTQQVLLSAEGPPRNMNLSARMVNDSKLRN